MQQTDVERIASIGTGTKSFQEFHAQIEQLSTSQRTEIEQVFNRETGKTMCRKCPNRFTDAVFELRQVLQKYKTNIPIMANSRFKLKKNRVVKSHSSAEITAANLTDEKALQLLKKSKTNKAHFEVLPPGWEAEVDAYVPGTKSANAPAASTATNVPDDETKKALDEAGKVNTNTTEQANFELHKKNFEELVKVAEAQPEKFPKEEWQHKNRKQLLKYLADKI